MHWRSGPAQKLGTEGGRMENRSLNGTADPFSQVSGLSMHYTCRMGSIDKTSVISISFMLDLSVLSFTKEELKNCATAGSPLMLTFSRTLATDQHGKLKVNQNEKLPWIALDVYRGPSSGSSSSSSSGSCTSRPHRPTATSSRRRPPPPCIA